MRLEAKVTGVYVGQVKGLEKESQNSIKVVFDGVEGDKHGGTTKPADSRNREYERGTPMRNDRQWTAVAEEELAEVADRMGVPNIEPGWIGANLSLEGIPNLTDLPKGSKLRFPSGAVLLVEDENMPCIQPGEVIADKYPDSDLKPSLFPKAALGRRGLAGVVEREGEIKVGDHVKVSVFKPKPYSIPQEHS